MPPKKYTLTFKITVKKEIVNVVSHCNTVAGAKKMVRQAKQQFEGWAYDFILINTGTGKTTYL